MSNRILNLILLLLWSVATTVAVASLVGAIPLMYYSCRVDGWLSIPVECLDVIFNKPIHEHL